MDACLREVAKAAREARMAWDQAFTAGRRRGTIDGAQAVRAFNLNPSKATTADVRARFRAKVKAEHPDVGGRCADVARIVELRDAAVAYLQKRGR
jgi:hypothetical protein